MKTKDTVVLTAFEKSMATALRDEFAAWCSKWPDTVTWHRGQAKKIEWWDQAADACRRFEIPASLLIYLVHGFRNSRPEDAEIPFSATAFRSEALLARTVANFRWHMNHTAELLNSAHILMHGKPIELPHSTIGAARLIAELSLYYFKTLVEIASYPYVKTTGSPLSDEAHDMLCYQLCHKHPFLLLGVAKTPRIKALAAANVFFQNDLHPWHAPVWEGLVGNSAFCDLDGLAGCEVRNYFLDLKPVSCWPLSLAENKPFSEFYAQPPGVELMLLTFPMCNKTDLFLATKAGMARSGSPKSDTPSD